MVKRLAFEFASKVLGGEIIEFDDHVEIQFKHHKTKAYVSLAFDENYYFTGFRTGHDQ